MAVPLSADHMSIHNSFGISQNSGGDYSMAMAYLLAWQGPVSEEDDPYGDSTSPDGLAPVCHVQEIRILPEQELRRGKAGSVFDMAVSRRPSTSRQKTG